jgi:hypothetical protein
LLGGIQLNTGLPKYFHVDIRLVKKAQARCLRLMGDTNLSKLYGKRKNNPKSFGLQHRSGTLAPDGDYFFKKNRMSLPANTIRIILKKKQNQYKN